FDFVVIDGPPLLPVADAQVLLHNPAIDVVLIVSRPYLTTREHIRGATAILKRHPDKGFGLVVNAVHERARGYYGYKERRDDRDVELEHEVLATEDPTSVPPPRNSRVGRGVRGPAPDELDHIVDPRSEH